MRLLEHAGYLRIFWKRETIVKLTLVSDMEGTDEIYRRLGRTSKNGLVRKQKKFFSERIGYSDQTALQDYGQPGRYPGERTFYLGPWRQQDVREKLPDPGLQASGENFPSAMCPMTFPFRGCGLPPGTYFTPDRSRTA